MTVEKINSLVDLRLTPEQSKVLKGMVDEVVNAKFKKDSYDSFISEVRERAKDELGMPSKLFNKVVKVAYEDNGHQLDEETTALLDICEQLGYYKHNEDDA